MHAYAFKHRATCYAASRKRTVVRACFTLVRCERSLRHARCKDRRKPDATTDTSREHAYEACMNPRRLPRTLIDGRHDARNPLQPVRPA
ncbi:hypothetical protein PSAB6_110246 [Paraburkholderia sabiae]|nr:hypothetical protein PSAB6_110246 [Paraburkholderia sabiae]